MRKLAKYVISSILLFLFIFDDTSNGYEYGPIIDRIIVYAKQYKAFIDAHTNATKIKYDLANGIPYPNVPQYPLTDRNVPFYLYTRNNPDVPEILYVGDSTKRLLQAGFDPSHDTVLYAHGFNRTFEDFASNFTTSLLPQKDINIIIIVWDSYAAFDVIYSVSVTVFRLGAVIARFVQTLLNAGADRKKMNLMGNSDGAASVALAAKQIHPRVGRLTVFDPVGNYFNYLPPTVRVSSTDADYVQIIHCSVYTEGLPPEITGDITFYMNGALIQTQCANYTEIKTIAHCSHVTCASYLNESLKKNSSLLGIKCAGFLSNAPKDYDFSDQVILTYDVPTNFRGKYCVRTNYPPPPQF